MANTIRVYASDSWISRISDRLWGASTPYWNEEKYHNDPITLETNILQSASFGASGIGGILEFDFTGIPELQGMQVLDFSGPWVYVESTEESIDIRYSGARYGIRTKESNLNESMSGLTDTIPSNPFAQAKKGEYFNTQYGNPNPYWNFGREKTHIYQRLFLGFSIYPRAIKEYASDNTRPYLNCTARLNFSGHMAENKPYIDITYGIPEIYVSKVEPSNSFLDERQANTFSWQLQHVHSPTIGSIVQDSAAVQWRVQGTTDIVENLALGNVYSLTIPPNTLPNADLEWRVKAMGRTGMETEWSLWQPFTTIDSTPEAPRNLSPNGRAINGSVENVFLWDHVVDTGSMQYRYEVQISQDGKDWEPYADESTDRENMTVAPNSLPAGEVFWRVRTYNSDGQAGEWSSAVITVRRAPDAPLVSVTSGSNPRPALTWQVQGQTCFQVSAPGYDSGELYGTQKQFRLPVFLPDGENEIRVRVSNQYEMWSEWGVAVAQVANVPGDAVKLRAREVDCGVRLFWQGNYTAYELLRDGETIAETAQKEAADWTAAALDVHRYQVRGITEEGYYTLSNTAKARTRVKEAAICALGVWDWIPLRCRKGSPPEYALSHTQEVTYHAFSGRRLPVADVFERRVNAFSTSFSVTPEASRRLERLLGESVVLRYGTRMVGGILDNIETVGVRVGDDEDVQLSITCTEGAL